jgi:hypothetical protein
MKLILKSMTMAFLVELASLFLMPVLWSSSSGSSNPFNRLIAMHRAAILLLKPFFAGSGRSEMPQFILSVVVVQWIIFVFVFLTVGSIVQRLIRRSRQQDG